MNATRLLYLASGNPEFPSGDKACTLCASPHADGTPLDRVLSDTFSDHGMCRAPNSRSVCPACAYYFLHRWDVGQRYPAELRKRSLCVGPRESVEWRRETMRADLETWLTSGLPKDAALVISLAKKKHLLPLAPVTPADSRSFTLMFETQKVRASDPPWTALATAFDDLLALGCRKGEIISGNYDSRTLGKLPLDQWRKLDAVVSPHRGGALLELVSYVTIVADEEGDSDDPD